MKYLAEAERIIKELSQETETDAGLARVMSTLGLTSMLQLFALISIAKELEKVNEQLREKAVTNGNGDCG